MRSAAGRMPVVKVWCQDIAALEGELYSHQGSLWQARMNTTQTGGPHWVCLARAGMDGASVTPRGE
jgi:hypothetical protein